MQIAFFTLLYYIIGIVCLCRIFALTFGDVESRNLGSLANSLPRPLQIAFAVTLIAAGIYGGAKPQGVPLGAPTSPSAPGDFNTETQSHRDAEESDSSAPPRLSASALKNLPPIEAITNALPAWYVYDPTDTDGDFLPDFWEKGTYRDPLVPDSLDLDLDRDSDGLPDIYEFYYQTNPRRADTDADGFWDGYEIFHGMDPLVKNDANNPNEPDADHNGIPDIWQSPYSYWFLDNHHIFTDTNNDGWHDDIYDYNLPPASADNFDVEVAIWTTRSAALDWGDGRRFIIMPTKNARVKLRLPFDADFGMSLLAAPEGRNVQVGELWKAKISVEFLPRDGQRVVGNAIIGHGGKIMLRTKTREAVIKCFDAPAMAPMLAQTHMLGGTSGGGAAMMSAPPPGSGGDGDGPQINFTRHGFDVVPNEFVTHNLEGEHGPFTLTNVVGILAASATWDAKSGSMEPTSGMSSFLTISKVPPDGAEYVPVYAVVKLDSETAITNTCKVKLCGRHTFGVELATRNFSPHLGEELDVGVRIPGCPHYADAKWLEIEVLRESAGGYQHAGWFDLGAEAENNGQRLDVAQLGGSTIACSWDGKAGASLGIASHPDRFEHAGAIPFNRQMPAIESGKPVPPPFIHINVRLLDEEMYLIYNSLHKIYVPQIVRVQWVDDAISKLRLPIVHERQIFANKTLYAGYKGSDKALQEQTINGIRAKLPDANIRVVPFMDLDGKNVVELSIISGEEIEEHIDKEGNKTQVFLLGKTEQYGRLQNKPGGVSVVYIGSIYLSAKMSYKEVKGGLQLPFTTQPSDPFIVPITDGMMLNLINTTSAHEIGHAIGLVDEFHLHGANGSHNEETTPNLYMNKTINVPWFFSPHPAFKWKSANEAYIDFVCPKPKTEEE